jgi:hypothetical protein
MKKLSSKICAMAVLLAGSSLATWSQTNPNSNLGAAIGSAGTPMPHLVKFNGTLQDVSGVPANGTAGVTFAIYSEETGGAPLWMETQNVQTDKNGHYTVLLGSAKDGLPVELFSSALAKWLGVRPAGQAEQPRVLLWTVPYAMKAADAETIGGLPPSAFVLAPPPFQAGVTSTGVSSQTQTPLAASVTGSGTTNFVPLWSSSSALGNSVLFQLGSGGTAKVGIGTTAPGATLDVKGSANIEGLLTLPATGSATATAGKNSQPQDFIASAYSSTKKAAVSQAFQWRAEPAANNTAAPAGTLNLLFGAGGVAPAETGLKLSSKGVLTFAPGQTFPGAGTITGVTAGTDLTGGGTSGNVTLNLNTSTTDGRYARLAAPNTFTASQTVNGAVSATVSSGTGVAGTSTSGSGVAGTSTSAIGMLGTSSTNVGVYGTSGSYVGVFGQSTSNIAVYGTSSTSPGVEGVSKSGNGVFGFSSGGTGAQGNGVYGQWIGSSSAGSGLFGIGVWGDSASGQGVIGTSDARIGVFGGSTHGPGVSGWGFSTSSIGTAGTYVEGSLSGDFGNAFSQVGVWGDTGVTGGFGVVGTADDGNSYIGKNNSPAMKPSTSRTIRA